MSLKENDTWLEQAKESLIDLGLTEDEAERAVEEAELFQEDN